VVWCNLSAVSEKTYEPRNVLDETGYGIGTSRSNKVIIDTFQKSQSKVIPGRQEWMTAIQVYWTETNGV
jgi:hypothetical protein